MTAWSTPAVDAAVLALVRATGLSWQGMDAEDRATARAVAVEVLEAARLVEEGTR